MKADYYCMYNKGWFQVSFECNWIVTYWFLENTAAPPLPSTLSDRNVLFPSFLKFCRSPMLESIVLKSLSAPTRRFVPSKWSTVIKVTWLLPNYLKLLNIKCCESKYYKSFRIELMYSLEVHLTILNPSSRHKIEICKFRGLCS